MSVIKSKRNIAYTQFLRNLQMLQNEVLAWCKKQGYKNSPYGLEKMFNMVSDAFYNAYTANKIFIKDEESFQKRKKYFDESIQNIHNFNAMLTTLMDCYNISNTKIKRWSKYSYESIRQMDAIKKKDKAKIDKINKVSKTK